MLSSDYRNTPRQITSNSGCFTLQRQNAVTNYIYVSLFFRMKTGKTILVSIFKPKFFSSIKKLYWFKCF